MNMKEASNGYEDMREVKTRGVKKEYGMHEGHEARAQVEMSMSDLKEREMEAARHRNLFKWEMRLNVQGRNEGSWHEWTGRRLWVQRHWVGMKSIMYTGFPIPQLAPATAFPHQC